MGFRPTSLGFPSQSTTAMKKTGPEKNVYGRIRYDGYLTKKLGIHALLYVHIVDYLTTFEVFS